MTARRLVIALAAVAALVLAPLPAEAAPTAKQYRNCTEIHRVYSGGIAKKGVTANRTPSGLRPLKGKVKFDTALYTANRKSDRDGDAIACELS